MTTTERIFIRYEELAINYANKIWNENKISLEKDDLYQEMRIKLFLAIKAYAKRWSEYKKQSARKPIPLEFYLRTAMANKVRDFISDISSAADRGETSDFDKGALYNQIIIEGDSLAIGGDSIENIFTDKYEKRVFNLLVENDFDEETVLNISSNKKLAKKTIMHCMFTFRKYLNDNSDSEYREFFVNNFSED